MTYVTPERIDPPAEGAELPFWRILPLALLAVAVPTTALAVGVALGGAAPALLWLVALGGPLVTWPLVVVLARSHRGRLHLETVDGATMVTPPAAVRGAIAVAPFVALAAIPVGLLDLTRSVGTGWTVVAVLAGALAAPDALRQASGRRWTGLRLTPEGVQSARQGLVPWDQVDAVRLHARPGPRVSVGGTLTLDPRLVASDGDLLRRFVAGYLTHPRRRAELADGRAIDRARRGDL